MSALRSNRRTSLFLFHLASFSMLCTLPLAAQTAPTPASIGSAQSVFAASAGAPELRTREKEAVSWMYDSLFQQLNAWGKYKVVTKPADADLALEISLQVSFSDVTNGSSIRSAFMKLDIRDRSTHALLWTLDEPIRGAFREKTFQKNINDTMTHLIDDLKALAAGHQPGDPTQKDKP